MTGWRTDIFERGGKKTAEVDEDTVRALHAKIGELAVANDFLSRKLKPWAGNETRDDRAEPSRAVGGRAVPPAVVSPYWRTSTEHGDRGHPSCLCKAAAGNQAHPLDVCSASCPKSKS